MTTDVEAHRHDAKISELVNQQVGERLGDSDESINHSNGNIPNDDAVDAHYQRGIQDIEAVTLSWSRTSLITAFVLIWCVYFVQGLVAAISAALLPFVTSSFAEHSLMPTTAVMSSVIGGVTNLTIGKTLDIFGRPQGFLVCVMFATVGLIMSAACNNVQAYAASQVFYTVGINGIGYTLSVFLADTTSLRYRGLIQSLCFSPNIITAWLGGPISTAFLNGPGWRWAFGMESILVPSVALPLFGLLMFHFSKAKKQGLVPNRDSGRTVWESLRYYLREFDAVGLFLLSFGVALFLLPFNLYTMQGKGFGSSLVICFLVFGILLLIAFGIWEKFFAEVSVFPWRFLQDRTVAGACILSFTLFVSLSCWAMYFTSILMVVNDLSVTHASYVAQINTVGCFTFTILTGLVISYTGRYKPVTLYVALPLTVLGLGLMIHFRKSDTPLGLIIMAQIFISVASGVVMVTDEIAILAATAEQQYFAISIAMVSMFGSMGSAVGLTISAAIWQNVMPNRLALYLPAEDLENLPMIYMDIVTQLSYAVGTPTRIAIQHAYGDVQKYLFTASASAWALGLVAIIMWRDINVIGIKQTKGHVI